ncbi:MAG: TonB-dependent receptor [Candidatus Zixiibacteriota bacterium]
MSSLVISVFLQFSFISDINADSPDRAYSRGTIKGRAVDADVRAPLVGANVYIIDSDMMTVTDTAGYFTFGNLPVGKYSLRFTHIGYTTVMKTDINVKPGRITYVNPELKEAPVPGKKVKVTSGFFPAPDRNPVGTINFSRVEIERSPGFASDVTRVIKTLPSVASFDDRFNNLIVRGGNPIENGFLVDGIPITNINHYASYGAPGGIIGLLNIDLFEELDFYTGGFPAWYGDRLSSYMDIKYREGNRNEFDGKVVLDLSGCGLIAEGPLDHGRGSWLVAARRGFLDVLMDIIDIDMAPRHWDIQTKVTYDLSPNNKLSALIIAGASDVSVAREDADVLGGNNYGDAMNDELDVGLSWRYLWNQNGYSDLILSRTHINYDFLSRWYESDSLHFTTESDEDYYLVKNVQHLKANDAILLDFGLSLGFNHADIDHYFAKMHDDYWRTYPEKDLKTVEETYNTGYFFSSSFRLNERLNTTIGIRSDYFSYNAYQHWSPRLSLSYKLSGRTVLTGAFGVYYQNLPMIFLSQYDNADEMKVPRCHHYILGINQIISDDMRLTLEFYEKQYRNFPIDVNNGMIFLIDEVLEYYGFFLSHQKLSDEGRAVSHGIEATLQKKFSGELYGLLGATYFESIYRGLDDVWRNRINDNRVNLTAECGFRPSENWEFKIRWEFAGGRPYTPYDSSLSVMRGIAILDMVKINKERLPAYHALSVRIDRSFNFARSNLRMYVSIWNLYNHDNVATYDWSEAEERTVFDYQLSLLPVAGIEYEF